MKYRVELRKPAFYHATAEVEAGSIEAAEAEAMRMEEDAELDWDCSDPGGDTEITGVVDCEERDAQQEERRQALAKEVRVVARPFFAYRWDDFDAPVADFILGDVLTKLSVYYDEDDDGHLNIAFDSRHGRCYIPALEVFRRTGCTWNCAFPPQTAQREEEVSPASPETVAKD